MPTDASQAEQTLTNKSVTSSLNKRWWAGGVVFLIILALLVGGGLIYQKISSTSSSQNATISESDVPPKIGVVITQNGDGELPIKHEIDQEKYSEAIEAAWEEAQQKAPQSIVSFPKNPQLIAFSFLPTNATASNSLVLYTNRPVSIDTKPVSNLPENAKDRLTLTSSDYQLVVTYEYTPEVTELDVPTILTEAFTLAMTGNRNTTKAKSIPKIVAFDALVR